MDGGKNETRLAAPEETRAWGERLGRACRGGEVIWLAGGLGAGKTCLAQGLAAGLGVPPGMAVTSPTFVLHNQYPGRLRLDHFDLYRLAGPSEAGGPGEDTSLAPAPPAILDGLGLDEWWGAADGVCAIEWPGVLGGHRPEGGLEVRLDVLPDGARLLSALALDRAHRMLLESMGCGA